MIDGLRVAVVGVGKWGLNHLGRLGEVVGPANAGYVDPDDGRRAAARDRVAGARAFGSFGEFLDSDWPAVIIAAPAAAHAELAARALAAGKDVLVEKPLALTVEDAAALVNAAEAGRRILMVGHLLLYQPAFVALKRLVDDGDLGVVRYLTATRAKLGTIRTEEDVFFSLAAHDVAAALWFAGREPRSVSALAAYARGAELADAAWLDLVFADGVVAHCFASWLFPDDTRRFVIVGDRAMATVEQAAGVLTVRRARARDRRGPVIDDDGATEVPLPTRDALAAEIAEFVACVGDRRQPRADGAQGLAVVRILAAGRKSAAGGGVPVRLEPAAPKEGNI